MTKKRIDWLDVSKAIAVILMVIGHTPQLAPGVRNFDLFVSYAVVFYIEWIYLPDTG